MSYFIDEGPYLVDETSRMMREQRRDEQAGKRHIAAVHARDHDEDLLSTKPSSGLGEEYAPENDVPQHPDLDKQLYDGVDINLSVDPKNSSNAKMAIDNELREQAIDQQLRLGLQPGLGHRKAPTPGSAFGA